MKSIKLIFLSAIACVLLIQSCENENKNTNTSVFVGKLISHTECKSSKSVNSTLDTPDSVSCAEYAFNAQTNILSIKHVNAAFNCCPGSISCTVGLQGDTILIQEFEARQSCNCDCLYDLEIEVMLVNAGQYQVKFVEPYCGNQPQLLFGIDLSVQQQGSFCVNRNQYPWGK